MSRQDYLREQVKLAKVYNDEWTYKTFSEAIGMSNHRSFYNWLNGQYDLSYKKARELEDIVSCLLD